MGIVFRHKLLLFAHLVKCQFEKCVGRQWTCFSWRCCVVFWVVLRFIPYLDLRVGVCGQVFVQDSFVLINALAVASSAFMDTECVVMIIVSLIEQSWWVSVCLRLRISWQYVTIFYFQMHNSIVKNQKLVFQISFLRDCKSLFCLTNSDFLVFQPCRHFFFGMA